MIVQRVERGGARRHRRSSWARRFHPRLVASLAVMAILAFSPSHVLAADEPIPGTFLALTNLACNFDEGLTGIPQFDPIVSIRRVGQSQPGATTDVGVSLGLRYQGTVVHPQKVAGLVRGDGSVTNPGRNAPIAVDAIAQFGATWDQAPAQPIVQGRTYTLRILVIDFDEGLGTSQVFERDCPAVITPPELETCGTAPERSPEFCYAPRVYLHSDEDYLPMSPDAFIENSALRFAHDHGCEDETVVSQEDIDPVTLGQGGYSAREAALPALGCSAKGDPIPSDEISWPYGDRSSNPPARDEGYFLALDESLLGGQSPAEQIVDVVWERVTDETGDYITYWFFYPFNSPRCGFGGSLGCAGVGDHEGDWEQIVVRLDAKGRAETVTTFAHGHVEDVGFYEPGGLPPEFTVERVPGSSNPVVYSARGSHATYLHSGGTPAGGKVSIDMREDGIAWDTWRSLKELRTQPWAGGQGGHGFRGAWGRELPNTNLLSSPPTGPPCKNGLTGKNGDDGKTCDPKEN